MVRKYIIYATPAPITIDAIGVHPVPLPNETPASFLSSVTMTMAAGQRLQLPVYLEQRHRSRRRYRRVACYADPRGGTRKGRVGHFHGRAARETPAEYFAFLQGGCCAVGYSASGTCEEGMQEPQEIVRNSSSASEGSRGLDLCVAIFPLRRNQEWSLPWFRTTIDQYAKRRPGSKASNVKESALLGDRRFVRSSSGCDNNPSCQCV